MSEKKSHLILRICFQAPPPQSDDELPPPLPPKKHQREASLEAEEDFHSLVILKH